MKILITGGAGFIGSEVIRQAIRLGHKIANIDKLTYASNHDSLDKIKDNSNYKFYKADICDKHAVENIFNIEKPDCVMHLAAESHVDNSILKPINFINTNILGTFNLLQASLNHWQLMDDSKKNSFIFHHISTDEVYGDLEKDDPPFQEKNPYKPSSPYSASKASSDHFVRSWNRTYNLPVIVTNCSNNYGPFQFPEKLIPKMIFKAINGEKLPIYGNGSQIRDWLYVSDHAKALLKVITDGKNGETYNIGGNNEKQNIEVVNLICKILEFYPEMKPNKVKKFSDLILFTEDRPGHDCRYAIDSSKIHKDLNWTPEESFETGLEKTVHWYAHNISWLRQMSKNK